MKKRLSITASFILVFATFILLNACKTEKTNEDYLKVVLANLEQIKSATYNSETEVYTPWDTLPSNIYHEHYIELRNTNDTFLGVSFVNYNLDDSMKLRSCYDGNMIASVYEKNKGVLIDSFKFSRFPFRLVRTPFFAENESLINYILSSSDSILIESISFEDSIHFSFSIYDDLIEIIGNQIVHDTLHRSPKAEISKYDIWISKSNDLPYRFKRDMPHEKTIQEVENVELNTLNLSDFKATDFFPKGYTIKEYKGPQKAKKNSLNGKLAVDWILNDVNGNVISFKDLKSKVLVLQFTGIGCGACIASIPFLKELATDYRNKDFELISIETWRSDLNLLKNYQEKNEFNFKFLNANDNIKKDYNISAVPVFFILDENRIIRKVINGYAKSTNNEIKNTIDELLK